MFQSVVIYRLGDDFEKARIVYAHPTIRCLLGWEPEELYNMKDPIAELVHPDYQDKNYDYKNRILHSCGSNEVPDIYDVKVRHKAGYYINLVVAVGQMDVDHRHLMVCLCTTHIYVH